jgi:acyl transferase domain-containing protein
MDKIHELSTGYSLIAQTGLFAQRTHSAEALGKVWPIAVTLPALTMLQIATYDSLVGLGMKPTAIVGHSAGETALLYASGAGPKAMTVELAIARGRAMTIVEGSQGAMAAVSCSPEQAQEIISQIHTEQGKADLDVGCYNTPGAITLRIIHRYRPRSRTRKSCRILRKATKHRRSCAFQTNGRLS